MAVYQTEHRRALIRYMQHCQQRAMTAQDLAAALRSDALLEHAPGLSTIYRLLEKLVDEGIIRRLRLAESRSQTYQMDGNDACWENLHLKCVSCGCLRHLPVEERDRVVLAVRHACSFRIDVGKTTLFGLFSTCDQHRTSTDA